MTDATPFLPGLSAVAGRSLTAAQDAGNLTSNGGLVVLREAANRMGLAGAIADPLPDTRNPLFVVHSYRAMVTARIMAIAAGCDDADDLDALRHDPALLMACNRAPEGSLDIASQPTISRLPMGMAKGDPLPLDQSLLAPLMFVGDVAAGHGETRLIRAARAAGCRTADGDAMVVAVLDVMCDMLDHAWS